MKSKEITEGNKLIAEFMGAKEGNPKGRKNKVYINVPIWHGDRMQKWTMTANDLLYHLSWAWLMPVVEKIESISVNGVEDIGRSQVKMEKVEWQFTVEISCSQSMIHRDVLPQYYGTEEDFLKLYDCNKKSKKESVWLAVIEFIKWYNLQTKKP